MTGILAARTPPSSAPALFEPCTTIPLSDSATAGTQRTIPHAVVKWG